MQEYLVYDTERKFLLRMERGEISIGDVIDISIKCRSASYLVKDKTDFPPREGPDLVDKKLSLIFVSKEEVERAMSS